MVDSITEFSADYEGLDPPIDTYELEGIIDNPTGIQPIIARYESQLRQFAIYGNIVSAFNSLVSKDYDQLTEASATIISCLEKYAIISEQTIWNTCGFRPSQSQDFGVDIDPRKVAQYLNTNKVQLLQKLREAIIEGKTTRSSRTNIQPISTRRL